jgi:hypothetical protein
MVHLGVIHLFSGVSHGKEEQDSVETANAINVGRKNFLVMISIRLLVFLVMIHRLMAHLGMRHRRVIRRCLV